MKDDRQSKILEIIEREPIDTQEQLQQRLQEQGIPALFLPENMGFPAQSMRGSVLHGPLM